MSPPDSKQPALRARPIVPAALLGACVSCMQVLGIPTDPELVETESPNATSSTSAGGRASSPGAFGAAGGLGSAGASGTPSEPGGSTLPDGVLPPGNVSAIDPSMETKRPGAGDGPLDSEPVSEPGAPPDAGGAAPPGPDCVEAGRVPVDVVFIVDNSGSMPEETEAFELALPSFVARLDEDGVDHRVILLSRHRRDDRSASEEASTSVCIAAPISGLAACPSQRPALGERFFQYSVKIDDGDSLSRALQTFSAPDSFELTASGWSGWLRPGAFTVFIELTDSDSALGASAFVAGLQAAAPERFGADPARPDFVFHAVTGVVEKALSADIYFADEPIETAVCSGTGSNPDNAGVVYQELSRLTGGVRSSICPAAPFTLRLTALALAVSLRSERECSN